MQLGEAKGYAEITFPIELGKSDLNSSDWNDTHDDEHNFVKHILFNHPSNYQWKDLFYLCMSLLKSLQICQMQLNLKFVLLYVHKCNFGF